MSSNHGVDFPCIQSWFGNHYSRLGQRSERTRRRGWKAAHTDRLQLLMKGGSRHSFQSLWSAQCFVLTVTWTVVKLASVMETLVAQLFSGLDDAMILFDFAQFLISESTDKGEIITRYWALWVGVYTVHLKITPTFIPYYPIRRYVKQQFLFKWKIVFLIFSRKSDSTFANVCPLVS